MSASCDWVTRGHGGALAERGDDRGRGFSNKRQYPRMEPATQEKHHRKGWDRRINDFPGLVCDHHAERDGYFEIAALRPAGGRSPLPTPVPAGRCCTSPSPPFSHLLVNETSVQNPTLNRNRNSRPATASYPFCNPRTKRETRQRLSWCPPPLFPVNIAFAEAYARWAACARPASSEPCQIVPESYVPSSSARCRFVRQDRCDRYDWREAQIRHIFPEPNRSVPPRHPSLRLVPEEQIGSKKPAKSLIQAADDFVDAGPRASR